MKDLLGNTIAEGSLVWWLSKQIPMKVTKITTGGISIGREVTPPKITLEITIPVDVKLVQSGEEPQFTDFLCTMNPDAEKLIEGMLEGQRTQ
jgi:hypothetical protein